MRRRPLYGLGTLTAGLLICLFSAGASAEDEPGWASGAVLTSPVPGAPVSYDYGMELRRRGDNSGAKAVFLELLEKDPSNTGALEGLSLSCLSLGQYSEALGYLERWNSLSPRNKYVLGLLLDAQDRFRDEEGALNTYRELAACAPGDCSVKEGLDSYMEKLRGGVFPYGRSYRTHSMEDLDTPSPQRILYEGNSAGASFREPLKPGLDLIGGAELAEEAQRNETSPGHEFAYYDILDQTYSAGLSGRPDRDFNWEAEYGQSELYDLAGPAVGNRLFSNFRLFGQLYSGDSRLSLSLTRSPRYLRGYDPSGAYFRLLGENSAKAEGEFSRWDWDWLARAGLVSTSDGSSRPSWSVRGVRELDGDVLQAGYYHGQQQFYNGSADRRLRYVDTDDLALSFRRYVKERYRAAVSYGYTSYSDSNAQGDLEGELTGWLPWQRNLYGTYRYSRQDFRDAYDGYYSVNTRAHWLGAYWRACGGRNWSASAGYEHGFIYDRVRRSYEGNNYLAGLDWYYGTRASVRLSAGKSDTSVGDKSCSFGLRARYSFR